jgi:hypothetical protein
MQDEFKALVADPAQVVELLRRPDGVIELSGDSLVGKSSAMIKAKPEADPEVYEALKGIADDARLRALD